MIKPVKEELEDEIEIMIVKMMKINRNYKDRNDKHEDDRDKAGGGGDGGGGQHRRCWR